MNEEKIILDCKDLYTELISMYKATPMEFDDDQTAKAEYKKLANKMFDTIDGRITAFNGSAKYVMYEAEATGNNVGKYTFGGSIMRDELEYSFRRIAEDICMAFYRFSGGSECKNTYEFLEKIR